MDGWRERVFPGPSTVALIMVITIETHVALDEDVAECKSEEGRGCSISYLKALEVFRLLAKEPGKRCERGRPGEIVGLLPVYTPAN
jgi:hypothetical protein